MKIYIGLHSANSIFDKIIRWQTRSKYSHVSISLEKDVIEATRFYGVRKFQKYKFKKDEYIDMYSTEVTSEQFRKISQFLYAQVGKKYDITMVLRFLSRESESGGSKDKWFCSELIYAAFEHAGISLLNNTKAWEVSPGLLSRSTMLHYEFTLRSRVAAQTL